VASVAALRDGIKVNLATLTAPNGKDFHVHDTWPSGQVVPPAALVRPVSRRWMTLDASTKVHSFEVVVLVQLGSLGPAQDELDAFMSDTGTASTEAAILSDPTLQVATASIMEVTTRDYGVIEVPDGGVPYLGYIHDVQIMA